MSTDTSIAIQPYLPQCTAQLEPTDYQSVDATTFQPGNLTYYTVTLVLATAVGIYHPHLQDMWRVWLPGAVLGGVALFAAACFLVWLLTLCCRPHAYTYQLEWLANSPFYSSSRSVQGSPCMQIPVLTHVHAGSASAATTAECNGCCCLPPSRPWVSVPGAWRKPSLPQTSKCHDSGRW